MLLLATVTIATQLVSISRGPIQGGNNARIVTSSWYGDESGKTRADGHPYDKMAMTVAHKTLPFGTKILLYNLATGRQVVVTVRDRGPFIKGRELDCSEGVARQLGFYRKGVEQLLAVVLYEPLPKTLVNPRLKLLEAKVNGQSRARSSIPKFLAQSNLMSRDKTRLPFYCTDYLPLEFRGLTARKQPQHVVKVQVVDRLLLRPVT
jgi:rare lipoprotein A (peptidoglycan hydrolase)